jgi:hypothetical protein
MSNTASSPSATTRLAQRVRDSSLSFGYTRAHGHAGPIAKNLGRTSVCQSGTCTISNSVKKVFVSKNINKHLTTLGNALLEAQDRGFLDNVTHAATTSS